MAIGVGGLKAIVVGFLTNGEEADFEMWRESNRQHNEVRWFWNLEFELMQSDNVDDRLHRIEELLLTLVSQNQQKEYYSTAEVAEILDRAEFTVREWCRLGRIWAEKRSCGRGRSKEWMISHEELQRIRNEGLLPL